MKIFTEEDVILGYTDKDILRYMGSSSDTLEGSDIIDEDNNLFYVDPDIDTINNELEDYYRDTVDNVVEYAKDNITVFKGSNEDLYAIFNQ